MGASWNTSALSINSRNADAALTPTQLVTGGTARASRAKPGVLIIPGRKLIAATMSGEVITAGYFPNFVGGVLTPKMTAAQPSTGNARYVDISAISLRGGLI